MMALLFRPRRMIDAFGGLVVVVEEAVNESQSWTRS